MQKKKKGGMCRLQSTLKSMEKRAVPYIHPTPTHSPITMMSSRNVDDQSFVHENQYTPASVAKINPQQKPAADMAAASFCCPMGTFMSLTKVSSTSTVAKLLSTPRQKSMKKKQTQKSCGQGSRERPAGYTTKARPRPSFVTSATGTPASWAKCPRIEKTPKPAKTLVKALISGTWGGEGSVERGFQNGRERTRSASCTTFSSRGLYEP